LIAGKEPNVTEQDYIVFYARHDSINHFLREQNGWREGG